MGLTETLIFYCVIGLAVAVAVFIEGTGASVTERSFRVTTAVLFWPLYLPTLLARPKARESPPAQPPDDARDEMTATIAQVDAELDAALGSLDGWAEDVLAHQTERIGELRTAWNAQAARIREMDRLLTQPDFAGTDSFSPLSLPPNGSSHDVADRRRHSEQSRRRNIEQLKQVRRKAHEDLMATLAWVRELVSMIHLAKFTGAPASRAEELVAQIAAAVEGVSAVTWQDELVASQSESRKPETNRSQLHRQKPEDQTWVSSSVSATSSPPT